MEENNQQPNNNNDIKTIRTYASDMADSIRDNDGSVIKIAMAEQKRNEMKQIYAEDHKARSWNIFWIIGSILLIGGALYGSYVLYGKYQARQVVTPVQTQKDTFLVYDKEVSIDISGIISTVDIASAIRKEAIILGDPQKIKAIFLNQKVNGIVQGIKTSELMTVLNLTAPGELTRSLTENFLLGSYTGVNQTVRRTEVVETPADTTTIATNGIVNIAPTPEEVTKIVEEVQAVSKANIFLVFETKDYNIAYAGMLTWEKTIVNDMFVLFDLNVSQDGDLFSKTWKDVVINNKDARVLYDKDGNGILYYIFANKNKLIITDSKDAIKEVVTRLLSKNTKPL